MNWDIQINIRKSTTDFGKKNTVLFEFKNGNETWNKIIDSEQMHDEKTREIILKEIARGATNELIAPKLVNGMLHALVSAALKGDNPLE